MNKKSSKVEKISGDTQAAEVTSSDSTTTTTTTSSSTNETKVAPTSPKSNKKNVKIGKQPKTTESSSATASVQANNGESSSIVPSSDPSSDSSPTSPQTNATSSNEQMTTNTLPPPNSTQLHGPAPLPAQYLNYYPYMQAGITGGPPPPPTLSAYAPVQPLDVTTAANWSQAMAAATMAMASACGNTDPASLAAAYMNAATAYPTDLTTTAGANPGVPHSGAYEQFGYGFTPAFGFGYNANGQIDYTNSNQPLWTPGGNGHYVTNGSTHNSPPLIHHHQHQSHKNSNSNVEQNNPDYSSTKHGHQWIQLMQDPSMADQQISPIYQQHQYAAHSLNYRHVNQHYHHQGLQPHHQHHHQHYRNVYNNDLNRYPPSLIQPVNGSTGNSTNNNGSAVIGMNGGAVQFYPLNSKHQQNNYQYNPNNPNKLDYEFNSMHLNNTTDSSINKFKTDRRTSSKYNNNSQGSLNSNGKSLTNKNRQNTNKTNENTMQFNENDNTNTNSIDESNSNISKSDSKTWASIVGVSATSSTQQSSNNNSNTNSSITVPVTTSPTTFDLEQQDLHQYNNNPYNNQSHQNYMNNNKNFYQQNNKTKPYKKYNYNNGMRQPPQDQQQQQQAPYIEFNLNNGAFPPISVNSNSSINDTNKTDNNEKTDEKSFNSNNIKEKNSIETTNNSSNDHYQSMSTYNNNYKKQQYNNYQKQQQRQFGSYSPTPGGTNVSATGGFTKNKYYKDNKYQNSNNKESQSNDNEENSNYYYYKRHQPTQLSLSSYIKTTDKNILFENKNKNQENSTLTTNNTDSSTNNTYSASAQTKNGKNMENQVSIQLKSVNTNPSEYNPKEFNLSPKAARFFVIKSYSEDDVHRSIKYNIWCSTEHGNRRLDMAFAKSDGNIPVYLFFSVNGSGHFCGMAEMTSRVDYHRTTGVWSQDKWKGCLQVKWIYVKDVPNALLRNIKLENNDNKPVTNSRDTQEIPFDKGKQVLKVFHTFNHSTSIFDDFEIYEKKLDDDTYRPINDQTSESSSSSSTSSSSSASIISSSSLSTTSSTLNVQQQTIATTSNTNIDDSTETTTNNNNKNELNKNLSNEASNHKQKTLSNSNSVEAKSEITPSATSSSSSSTSSSAEDSSKEDTIIKSQQPKLVAMSS